MYRPLRNNLINSSAFSVPFRYIYNILYRRRWHSSFRPPKHRFHSSFPLTPSTSKQRKFTNLYLFCPLRQLSSTNIDVEKNQSHQDKLNHHGPTKSQTDNNISDDDGVIIVNTSNSPTATPKPTSSFTSGFIDNFSKLSTAFRRQSVLFRVSCALVVCLIVISVLTTVALLWYYMGWMYGVQAIVVAVIAVLGASGIWHWFGKWLYVAALTAPRDAK